MDIHKIFISYYHDEDQSFKDTITDVWNKNGELFDDYSVNDGDIDDENMSDEQIRQKIRDDYIRDASVLVLLCGRNTKHRKFIDWELHAAMYDSELNPKMGILVINLPGSNNSVRACEDREKEIVSPTANWTSYSTKKEYEDHYPSLPQRLIDSLYQKHSDITFVNWETVALDHNKLVELIDFAFKRRKTVEYYLADPLRRKNSN